MRRKKHKWGSIQYKQANNNYSVKIEHWIRGALRPGARTGPFCSYSRLYLVQGCKLITSLKLIINRLNQLSITKRWVKCWDIYCSSQLLPLLFFVDLHSCCCCLHMTRSFPLYCCNCSSSDRPLAKWLVISKVLYILSSQVIKHTCTIMYNAKHKLSAHISTQ